jgi:hypothetical protein
MTSPFHPQEVAVWNRVQRARRPDHVATDKFWPRIIMPPPSGSGCQASGRAVDVASFAGWNDAEPRQSGQPMPEGSELG